MGTYHTMAWTAAKLFERGAAHLAESPSNESLLAGLWTIQNEDLGGLTAPLSYSSETGFTRVRCWYAVLIRDKGLKPFGDGQRACSSR